MFLAHGPVSYLANELIQKKEIKKLEAHEQVLVALASLLFGILPDFDYFLTAKIGTPSFAHHNLITHTPILYIGIWIVLRLSINPLSKLFNKKTGKVLNKNLLNILVNTFLIGTIFHLLADTLVTRIMLLYPLSDFKFTVLFWLFEGNLFSGYFLSTMFVIELIFLSIFILVIYKKYFKQSKLVNILTKGLIVLFSILLPVSILISMNTYNRSYMYDSDGNINYDIDFDTLKDGGDMDVGNTGEDNIQKAEEENIVKSVTNIIESGKWAGRKDTDFVSCIRYRLGGFNSYRIISQTYYSINLPIEPVLKDFSIKRNGFESYEYSYDYPNLLFEYFEERDELIDIDIEDIQDINPSKIFFLIDKNDKILNMGITLEGNYLAIVLEDDTNLQKHSLENVQEYYGENMRGLLIQK